MDFTGFGSIADLATHILDRFVPDPAQKAAAALEILKAQQAGEFKQIDAQLALSNAQTDINKVEAGSTSLFVSGPRPALMWVGVLGVLYMWVLLPFGVFVYTTYNGHALPVPPPVIDGSLMTMLGGLMGVQIVARSAEKIKGVS